MTDQRQQALRIFQAGVAAADPYQAVKRCLSVDHQGITIALDLQEPQKCRPGCWLKIHLIAFGKAACSMAEAAQETLPASRLAGLGIAVTNYENVRPVKQFEVIGAGHPLPDLAGLDAAQQIAAKVAAAQQDELVLVLVSGGGSALLPAPHPDITLAEKIQTTELLLASGANINQINCVRKHLSTLKGGGLARLAAPAKLHALILSDVLGDDVSVIASGPTVPDETTFVQAIAVLKAQAIWEKVPAKVRALLIKGEAGGALETPKSQDPVFDGTGYTLIGSNALSVKASILAAQAEQYDTWLYSDNLQGEARDAAEQLARHAQQLLQAGLARPTALIAGGETIVRLKGTGRGGRNQEFALAFALAAERYHLPPCWTFLSGGTDGRDGPTDAAGGLVDGFTLARIEAAGINAQALLDNNDSYRALQQSQDLLDAGATGTNVADLQVLLIQPSGVNAERS
ncbi:MAG: glycerate kinase [Methylococcales bacterium]